MIEHTQVVPVVAEFDIPELSVERETFDTTSFLENKYAESLAEVSKGKLLHTLKTKQQTIHTETQVIVEYKDSIVYKEKEVFVEVPVEKELTWWQKFRIKAFWWIIAIALVGWRREIIKLVKHFI